MVCDENELAGFCVVCVSTRCFSIRVIPSTIFNHKFSPVKKRNCPIVYSENPLGRDSFSYGDQSVGKQYRSFDWFLHGAPYSIEGFLKNLSESFYLRIYVSVFVIAPTHYSLCTYYPRT